MQNTARPRFGVSRIAEVGFVAGGFVREAKLIGPARQMVRHLDHVLSGLLCKAAQCHATFLRLDHAGGPAAYEEKVVARTVRQEKLAYRHAVTRVAVEVGVILDDPPGGTKQCVDPLACALLGCKGHRLNL